MAQGRSELEKAARQSGGTVKGHSAQALIVMDTIYRRVDSPSNKVLHGAEPWSNFFALPVFALAMADLV